MPPMRNLSPKRRGKFTFDPHEKKRLRRQRHRAVLILRRLIVARLAKISVVIVVLVRFECVTISRFWIGSVSDGEHQREKHRRRRWTASKPSPLTPRWNPFRVPQSQRCARVSILSPKQRHWLDHPAWCLPSKDHHPVNSLGVNRRNIVHCFTPR